MEQKIEQQKEKWNLCVFKKLLWFFFLIGFAQNDDHDEPLG